MRTQTITRAMVAGVALATFESFSYAAEPRAVDAAEDAGDNSGAMVERRPPDRKREPG